MPGLRFKYFYKDMFNWKESEFLRNTRSHPFVVKNLLSSKTVTRVEQEEWFEKDYCQNPDKKIWIAYDEEIHSPIGYIQYTIDSVIHKRCEVGYVIHPLHQKKGFGNALVDWSIRNVTIFEEGIHRLWLTVFPDNEKAIHIYIKNGFNIDGLMKQYAFKNGIYRDTYIMSLLLKT